MKLTNLLVILVFIIITSCNFKTKEVASDNNTHKIEVLEVLQANAYTYLKVLDNKKEQWLAVSKREAQVGEIYYFDAFIEMNEFKSKDLDKTFESVYFIEDLRKKAEITNTTHDAMAGHPEMPANHPGTSQMHAGKPKTNKKNISIEPVENGVTIKEVYANRKNYEGKNVIIRGEVVKTNFEIMNKNWFHIQDGTEENGNFDLTVTSLEKEIKAGDVVTFEGKIALNKDFGYGYSYELLLEDATLK